MRALMQAPERESVQRSERHSARRSVTRRAWIALFGASAVLGMAGCGGEEPGAMTPDLERDLQMAVNAQRPRTAVVSALEGGVAGAPSGNQQGRREAVATPRRAPRPTPQAEEQETAAAPTVDETPAPAVVVAEQVEPTPAPAPDPTPQIPSTGGISYPTERGPSAGGVMDEGRGERGGEGMGRGRGGGMGGVIGVIIRGGSAGVDHCGPNDGRRGRNGGGAPPAR